MQAEKQYRRLVLSILHFFHFQRLQCTGHSIATVELSRVSSNYWINKSSTFATFHLYFDSDCGVMGCCYYLSRPAKASLPLLLQHNQTFLLTFGVTIIMLSGFKACAEIPLTKSVDIFSEPKQNVLPVNK